ncbi:MAG TPA: ATP-binding protein [Terriglobia bacterium]|jgi:two-component system sensor histidine kinase PilS (NtrC family)
MAEIAIPDRRKWLLRLIDVRLAVFTIFIAAEAIQNADTRVDLFGLLLAVYALSACWFGLLKLNQSYVGQSYAQIAVDLFLITWMVNRTGGYDSYFSSLYFLEIVMSSILLERRGAFVAGTVSSVLHFAHMDLAYFGVIRTTGLVRPELIPLQYHISLNIFGFCSVAFLSNFLAESWRRTGVELQKSTGQVAFLQAFSDRIMDSLGTGLITSDIEGRVYLFNRAAQEISGFRMDEALQLTVWEMFPGMLPKVDSGQFEISTTRKDGIAVNLRFSVAPVMIDEKNTAGYVWNFDDVTELRLLERQMRQKEQMAAIGAMSAGIAHEIRNPLASIAGSFSLLQSDLQLSTDQRQLVEIITRETERLNRTITGFLGYARPMTPNRREVDLAELISETVQLMRNSPELKQTHRIETWLRPVKASVDESMMRQVFYNLASNAFKAMLDGGTLSISLEGRNGNALIQFEDTGIGLGEEQLKRLFVPFNSSFRNGTGLGLPIVYQIITAHNGTISVQSQKGIGTTFVIDL